MLLPSSNRSRHHFATNNSIGGRAILWGQRSHYTILNVDRKNQILLSGNILNVVFLMLPSFDCLHPGGLRRRNHKLPPQFWLLPRCFTCGNVIRCSVVFEELDADGHMANDLNNLKIVASNVFCFRHLSASPNGKVVRNSIFV